MRLASSPVVMAWSTATMAILMMSAADPWMGALRAIRSAIWRRCRESEARSGRYRRRPRMVEV